MSAYTHATAVTTLTGHVAWATKNATGDKCQDGSTAQRHRNIAGGDRKVWRKFAAGAAKLWPSLARRGHVAFWQILLWKSVEGNRAR
jgi:hypothetical protein